MLAELVRDWNTEQDELRKDLPTFVQALEEAQKGDFENLELFFNYRKRIVSHKYDGRTQKSIVTYLVFMDKKINHFLLCLREKYSDNKGIISYDTKGDYKYKSVVSSQKFEADEIDAMFYDYISEFVQKHDLSKFTGESDSHRTNALIKYIKIDFENNILKATYNERQGIDRVQIDNEQYTVKNSLESVYFDDVTTGIKTEDGEYLTFLDTLGYNPYEDENEETKSGRNAEGEFIYENYKELLTTNQLEKFNMILDWCEQDGNSINDLFQRNNPHELSKSAISKILFPDRKTTSTMKDIDNLFKSMNSRVLKAMQKKGIVRERVEIGSSFNPLKNATKEENRLFKQYGLDKYVIGLSKSKLPDSPMYAGVKRFGVEPFITMEHYEQLLAGEMTVKEIIEIYNIDKKKLNAKNSECVTYVPTENAQEADMVLSEEDVENMYQNRLDSVVRNVFNGVYTFAQDGEFYVADTDDLLPIPTTEFGGLNNKNVLSYINTYTVRKQSRFMKISEVKHTEENTSKKMITPIELSKIRQEKKSLKVAI